MSAALCLYSVCILNRKRDKYSLRQNICDKQLSEITEDRDADPTNSKKSKDEAEDDGHNTHRTYIPPLHERCKSENILIIFRRRLSFRDPFTTDNRIGT